jgi:hypothetical protein
MSKCGKSQRGMARSVTLEDRKRSMIPKSYGRRCGEGFERVGVRGEKETMEGCVNELLCALES